MRTRRNYGCLVACLLATAPAWATDGVEPIGVSMQANARGGADVAVGDSALSQVENPASLAFLKQRLDFGLQAAFPTATWRGPLETEESHTKLFLLPNFGISMPLEDRWAVGLAFHSRAGLGTSYRMRHLFIPFMDRDVGGDMKCVDLEFNAAYRVNDQLALGAGLRLDVSHADFSTVLGPADVEFGRGRAIGGGFQIGAMYKPRDDLTFGLAYRSPTWATDLEGGVAKATILGVVPIPLGEASIVDFSLPQRIAFGAAWDVTPKLKLVGEVRWLNYSTSVMNNVKVRTNGLVNLGLDLPLGYRDQWAFMTGLEYRFKEHWVWSAGYHWATAPVPSENMLPMGATIPQHNITTGIRYERDNWWIGVGYIMALPTKLGGQGRSRIPLGIDYSFSEIEQSHHAIGIGFGFEW